MNSLVELKDGKPATTSRKVAEAFGMQHRSVLLAIRELEATEKFKLHNFMQVDFKTAKNQTYQEYVISEAGAMRLVMGFTGSKAAAVKEHFIEAFQAMQAKLAAKMDGVEWKRARSQGISTRIALADTIADFVAYAKGQGSKSADHYYSNITKMEYKALALVERGAKIGGSFRDTLDGMQLAHLMVAEGIALRAIAKGMADGLHYKEIYMLAKADVERFAGVVGLIP
jgi:Rha family phage regulatory protein